jgi:hypothetical protein
VAAVPSEPNWIPPPTTPIEEKLCNKGLGSVHSAQKAVGVGNRGSYVERYKIFTYFQGENFFASSHLVDSAALKLSVLNRLL